MATAAAMLAEEPILAPRLGPEAKRARVLRTAGATRSSSVTEQFAISARWAGSEVPFKYAARACGCTMAHSASMILLFPQEEHARHGVGCERSVAHGGLHCVTHVDRGRRGGGEEPY